MEAILLRPKDSEELKLITALLNKMKVSSKVLSETELEDIGLGILMKDAEIKN